MREPIGRTYEEVRDELLEQWDERIEDIAEELERIIEKAPALRPLLYPFVRSFRGERPRGRFGRFVDRVRMHYEILRLERKLARARTVKR